MKIIRPNLRMGVKLGAVAKAHSAMNGTTMAIYIGHLVYDDLKNHYPELMKEVPQSEAFISTK
jgi:hypothetical protein